MILHELLRPLKGIIVHGDDGIDIHGLHTDSRQVGRGDLFIAVRGTQVDGHAFVAKAIEQGAHAIVCETLPPTLNPGVTYIEVADSGEVVGPLAHHFYGDATTKMDLVGVTGTNGKTTVATVLYNMFRAMGYKCGLCSTVCNYIDGEAIATDHTTPDPITLNRLLGRMADEGCRYAFMEVSSHSVAQHRIAGLRFAGGIFTNLTRDHLDYHKTVEAYRDAKKAFFDELPADAFVVTNADDRNGMFMVQNSRARVRTYSMQTTADFHARVLEEGFEGMTLDIDGHETCVRFIGRFNVQNLLAVYGTAVMLGMRNDITATGTAQSLLTQRILVTLSSLTPVNGRFETIRSPQGVTAIVDYAHTPDALDNVLATIREIQQGRGSCITVCGAGGNRDKGKRPLMAQSAVRASDRVVITSDNPRMEDPQAIIDDMLAGLSSDDMRKVVAITDRRQAIRTACMMAQPGDVVLVAGKGHEDYQDIQGVKHHFDDHEEVRACFGI